MVIEMKSIAILILFVSSVLTHEFHIALKQNNVSLLKSVVLTRADPNSLDYGHWLTRQEIDALVATDPVQKKLVRDFLFESNVEIINEYADGFYCRAPMSTIEKLFSTRTVFVPDRNGIFVPVVADYKIPEQLQEVIVFIDGLVTRQQFSFFSDRNVSDNVDPGAVTREVFQRLYQIDSGLVDPTRTSAGAMEYLHDTGFSQPSLEICQKMNALPPKPVANDHIIGNNTGTDGESTLDIQMIAQIAGNVDLWYEEYGGWMYGWATDFYNRDVVPQVVSISWGWSEIKQCDIIHCDNITSKQYVERTNNEFLKIAARGITIVVAAGDAGSPGRTNEVCLGETEDNMNPVFPGSSEWVTSVGATFLVQGDQEFEYHTPICKKVGCANGTVEHGTTYIETGWTSGSGFDRWTATPRWQQQEVYTYLNSGVELPDQRFFNRNGRAYPDVAAIGQNCEIYFGNWQRAAGTSCSAPVFAAVVALLNDHQLKNGKSTLGYANPLLYKMYTEHPAAFHDVTVGNSTCTEATCCGRNFGFVATTGWDPVAGLGTPNVQEMKKYLDSL